jgi:hypothetical protein
MVRLVVALLLVANAGYYAWTQGWLAGWVTASPIGDRDPGRLARQVNPSAVTVLTPQAASALNTAPRDPALACLQAGPFDDGQIDAAEAALAALVPAGHWARVPATVPGTWIVYMGKYLDDETFQRKQAELRRLRVGFERVTAPADLAPGLSLGRFDSEALAEQSLADLAPRGVRTARVVQLAAPRPTHVLRVEGAETTLARQVLALRSDALGKGFGPCAQLTAPE